jgi:aryl-alcohol dehydrogenase-like predicted oxidoreductase
MINYGLGLIPWSPLAGGLLGGALKKQKEGRRANADFEKGVEAKREKLEAYEALCGKLGEEPAHVGLAWLLHQPGVTAPIIGPRTMEQMTGSLRAMEIKLDADTLAALDKIFPGPGQAPKAYSW